MSNSNSQRTVVGIIPVRYGSKRLPGKPLLKLCGRSIVEHVYERAKQATLLSDIIVVTDDERISAVIRAIGGKTVMTPMTIQSGSDRVAYVAKHLDASIVVNIQGDEPLIEPEMIDEAVQALLDDRAAEVSTPVRKFTSGEDLMDPNIVKVVMDERGFALYFSRSVIPFLRVGQDIRDWTKNHQFFKHIGLYVFRKQFLLAFTQWDSSPLEQAEGLEQLRILEHGGRIKCVVTEHDSYSIDTIEDFERLKTLMTRN